MHLPLLASLALLPGCPVFTEFLPDPQSVPDAVGEYAELAWTPESAFWDTLWIQFEETAPIFWLRNDSIQRLLLHRNAPEACPPWPALACERLTIPALPNSRTARWTLRAGYCRDTADIPAAKPGIAWQRSGPYATDWAEPSLNAPPEKKGSPGLPDPLYEVLRNDCLAKVRSASWQKHVWTIVLQAQQCQGKTVQIITESPFEATRLRFQAYFQDSLYQLPPISGQNSLWLRLEHPPGDFPLNDTLDTLLVAPGGSPLRITEVSPCPEEPVPEWFEISNLGKIPFPLQGVSNCLGAALQDTAALAPGTSLLLTRDSASLRQWAGFTDMNIRQLPLKALRNTSDTLRLCRNQQMLDSALWGTGIYKVSCPLAFTPQNTLLPPSPGFQRRVVSSPTPPHLEIHQRVLRLSHPRDMLRIRVRTAESITLRLIDRYGTLRAKRSIHPDTWEHWIALPEWRKCPPGPCFLQIQTQEQSDETITAVIVRP